MPILVEVSDPEDPRIEAFRAVRERDLVRNDAGFIAEGEVVLRALLASPHYEASAILIAKQRREALASLLAQAPAGCPVYLAEQTVLDGIVGFAMHRGILAFGRRRAEHAVGSAEDLLAALPARATILLLAGIANHDNLGGIFRNAAGFGADAVLLDATCCHPLYRKAIRVSVGATLLVPWRRLDPGCDVAALFARHGIEGVALTPGGAQPLARLARKPRMALLLGAEGPGLPPELLAVAQQVAIPMAGSFDSLNVATTSGISLYHLTQVARE